MSANRHHALRIGIAALVFGLLLCLLVCVPRSVAQSGITIVVLPIAASVQVPGGMQQFDAHVTAAGQNHTVHWTLSGPGCSGAACGTLSEASSVSGSAITYTAPVRLPSPARVTLTATSAFDNTKKAQVTIILTGPVSASLAVTTAKLDAPAPLGGKRDLRDNSRGAASSPPTPAYTLALN